MKILNVFSKFIAASALVTAALSANALTVGGVTWDPNADAANGFPELTDFVANGSLIETPTDGIPGTVVTGQGKVDAINSAIDGGFCAGCELTFTFSMITQSVTPTGNPNEFDFVFNSLVVNFYVDFTPDYNGSSASAGSEGGANALWLQLTLNGTLEGTGFNIGTGSDLGSGSGLFDVTGGLAAVYFDTNGELGGTDMSFTSSFQPVLDGNGNPTRILTGTWELQGNTISVPEPETMVLFGLGLLGLGFARRRK